MSPTPPPLPFPHRRLLIPAAAATQPLKSLPPLWTPPDRPAPVKPRRLMRHSRRKRNRCVTPPLRFSPTAWAKLLYLRDAGPTEIGGFGITSADDLLLVENIQLVRQTCTVTSVEFDDASVAELFDEQVDQGLRPEQFARVWIHTHPGLSASPSSVDETTFRNVFGRCDWAVMFILAKGGSSYARLQFRAGPGGAVRLPVRIDWRPPFEGTDESAWQAEYAQCVQPFELLHWNPTHKDPLEVRRDRWEAEFAPSPEFPRSTLYEDA
jgi:proteasome lid subunit RPN8/RPN11